MADVPKFTRFFRSVEGRAVARFGSGSVSRACEMIGAVRDGQTIVWDTEKVTPLPADYCKRYVRELNQAVRRGDLVEVSRADWEAANAPPKTSKKSAGKSAESED